MAGSNEELRARELFASHLEAHGHHHGAAAIREGRSAEYDRAAIDAIAAALAPAQEPAGEEGPQHHDGCSKEGFVGGCERNGCHPTWKNVKLYDAPKCKPVWIVDMSAPTPIPHIATYSQRPFSKEFAWNIVGGRSIMPHPTHWREVDIPELPDAT